MTETSGSETIYTQLQRIAELAQRAPRMAFTTLAHRIDLAWLHEAYRATRKDGAVGIDGQTADEYAKDLEANLQSLLERFKSGRYRAPAVREVEIPKTDGSKTRLIGIPTFEDKVLQRAVLMLLEAVYEQDFLDCNYGFRPGRSAHQALDALWKRAMGMQGGWVLDVGIEDFFGSLGHGHLRSFLDRRVRDGVLRRAIGKWLKAGVLKEGVPRRRRRGTPQGGVISPLLANVYLHEVLDRWFTEQVVPRMRGSAFLVRYADDVLMVFSREDDAQAGVRGPAQAARSLRSSAPPRQDLSSAVLSAEPSGPGERSARVASGVVRLPGLHPCLGKVPEGAFRDPTQDLEPEPASIASGAEPMAPPPPSPSDRRPAPNAVTEAEGPLRLLRDYRQLP